MNINIENLNVTVNVTEKQLSKLSLNSVERQIKEQINKICEEFNVPSRMMEYNRCKDDPVYFAEKYINVKRYGSHEKSSLTQDQKAVLKGYPVKSRWLRQSGKTTVLLIKALHKALFFDNSSIIFYGIRHDMTKYIQNKLQDIYAELREESYKHDLSLPTATTMNRNFVKFSNGSTIRFASMSDYNPDTHRGKSYDLVIFDEYGYCESDYILNQIQENLRYHLKPGYEWIQLTS